jgi:hypothetical protein
MAHGHQGEAGRGDLFDERRNDLRASGVDAGLRRNAARRSDVFAVRGEARPDTHNAGRSAGLQADLGGVVRKPGRRAALPHPKGCCSAARLKANQGALVGFDDNLKLTVHAVGLHALQGQTQMKLFDGPDGRRQAGNAGAAHQSEPVQREPGAANGQRGLGSSGAARRKAERRVEEPARRYADLGEQAAELKPATFDFDGPDDGRLIAGVADAQRQQRRGAGARRRRVNALTRGEGDRFALALDELIAEGLCGAGAAERQGQHRIFLGAADRLQQEARLAHEAAGPGGGESRLKVDGLAGRDADALRIGQIIGAHQTKSAVVHPDLALKALGGTVGQRHDRLRGLTHRDLAEKHRGRREGQQRIASRARKRNPERATATWIGKRRGVHGQGSVDQPLRQGRKAHPDGGAVGLSLECRIVGGDRQAHADGAARQARDD